MERGQESYYIRVCRRMSWCAIAEELGYGSHKGALVAAKKFAMDNGLPWPVKQYTKGEAIYRMRRLGVSWYKIANRSNQTTEAVWRCAYKYAVRHDLEWPPNG